MPNNRSGIPMYNENPQYSATISSQLPQGSPASFGTGVAKEMAGMGDAIGKWGTNLVEFALKQQEKADDNYVMRRENEMRRALNELMYNPKTGLTNQKGHNAKGTTVAFDDEADKLTQQFMSDVNNPYLQAKFQQRISQWLPGYRKTVAVHEGNETFSAQKMDIDTSIQDKIDSALRAPNAASAKVLYASLDQSVMDIQNILGLSKEAAEEYVQEKYSNGVWQIAQALQGRGDTQGLLDLQKETEGKVSADTSSKLAILTGKVQAQMKGIDIAKQYRNNPKYQNPDGTFNATLAIQDFDKEHGKGATRTERVWVGGGGGTHFSNQSVNDDIAAAAQEFNVDPALVAAVAEAESNGNQGSVSGVGALGVMQLMPDTAASLGVDPNNQKDNIRGGAKYLRQMLDMFGGDLRKAVAAYNAGPGAVKAYGGVPPYGETQEYVKRILDGTPSTGEAFYEKHKKISSEASSSGGGSAVAPYQMPTQGASIDEQVNNLKDTWKHGVMDWVGGVVKDVFGYSNPTISSAARSSARNAQVSTSGDRSWHVHNDALDVVFDEGQNLTQDQKDALVKYFEDTGMFSEVLYHDYGSGWHLHLGGLKTSTPPQGGNGGAGHWEERTVSAYNEQEYNEGLKWLKEQGEFSKAEHDTVFNNALNDALAKAKSLRMPSEVDALAHSYGLSETDAKRLYNVLLGARVDLADENQRYTDNQKTRTLRKQAEEDAQDNFFAWWNANANASDTEVRTKAADLGVSARFMHSLNNSIAKSNKGGISWFKNSYNKRVFSNAVAQNQLKGEQVSNAMDIVTRAEEEKGSPLTAQEITTIVNKASVEKIIYEGKWYEKSVKGRDVDSPAGTAGKDANGVDIDSEGAVTGLDEDDFEE